MHSRLPRGVRPRLEGKPRTPLSSRVATRGSWSPLSGLTSPFDFSQTLPVGGSILVPCSLPGPPVVQHLTQMVTMAPFSNCRTEIREVRARRDLRGPLVLPPHLTDKETEARRQAHPASVTEGQDSTRFAFAVFAYTGFPGTRNCSWRTLKITSVYSKPCHAVQ